MSYLRDISNIVDKMVEERVSATIENNKKLLERQRKLEEENYKLKREKGDIVHERWRLEEIVKHYEQKTEIYLEAQDIIEGNEQDYGCVGFDIREVTKEEKYKPEEKEEKEEDGEEMPF